MEVTFLCLCALSMLWNCQNALKSSDKFNFFREIFCYNIKCCTINVLWQMKNDIRVMTVQNILS